MMQPKKQIDFNALLLSVLTAGVIGCFGFLWNLNSSQARLQERDIDKTNALNELNNKINTVQLNIQDIRERVIKIETKQTRMDHNTTN